MALTEKKLRSIYLDLLKTAKILLQKGHFSRSLLYTHVAAYTSHTFFLSSFFEPELEGVVKNLSNVILKDDSNFTSKRKKVVMLNSLCTFRGGVTTQYVRAIMALGWDLLFVTEKNMKSSRYVEMYNELIKYPQITILEIPSKYRGRKRLQYAYDAIIEFQPCRLYMHLSPYDACFSAVSYALPKQIEKFYIDYTDHSLALGIGACDYSFEFRPLGCSASLRFRNINENRILLLPNYPILDDVPFDGWPKDCNEKIIILSGGNPWKIVDQNDTYFRLAKRILDENENVVIIYAGGAGDKYMMQKIEDFGLSDSFILLPWRKDIKQLFERCHIYLNTYPNSGATMVQYAASLSKPVLSYYPEDLSGPNKVETAICQVKNIQISCVGEESFFLTASRLISDPIYRSSMGRDLNSCVIDKTKFDMLFKDLSIYHENLLPYVIDENISRRHEQIEESIKSNSASLNYEVRMVSLLGLSRVTFDKDFLIAFVKGLFPKIHRSLSIRGFRFL